MAKKLFSNLAIFFLLSFIFAAYISESVFCSEMGMDSTNQETGRTLQNGYQDIEQNREDRFDGNYVDVDLFAQEVSLFVDHKEIGEWPCVTGNVDGEHETPTGVFDIDYMASPTTLCGYREDGSLDYASDVTYWMPFFEGFGLHDATWRSEDEFGGDTYTYNGSHGCVNLPFAAAEIIYKNVWPGFIVFVH